MADLQAQPHLKVLRTKLKTLQDDSLAVFAAQKRDSVHLDKVENVSNRINVLFFTNSGNDFLDNMTGIVMITMILKTIDQLPRNENLFVLGAQDEAGLDDSAAKSMSGELDGAFYQSYNKF